MAIKIIDDNKRDFFDLLLLADEQESLIDRYLDRGTLFTLYDDGLKSICVVTDEGDECFELPNLATDERFQRRGYGKRLIGHIFDYYRGKGSMVVGTGDVPRMLAFYESCGFVHSHRIANYFTEHYAKPIFEEGKQIKDKVYLHIKL